MKATADLVISGGTVVTEAAAFPASLAIAERSLDRWDAATANLREALQIYVDLGDRQKIGRSFTELTDALILAGRYPEAIGTARRDPGNRDLAGGRHLPVPAPAR